MGGGRSSDSRTDGELGIRSSHQAGLGLVLRSAPAEVVAVGSDSVVTLRSEGSIFPERRRPRKARGYRDPSPSASSGSAFQKKGYFKYCSISLNDGEPDFPSSS